MDLLTVLISGLLIGGIYALIAIGLNAAFGVVRVVNFAHGEMVMIGMYTAYFSWTWWSIDPYISSWLIALPLGFLLGLVIQRFVIQRLLTEPLMQMFATFGLLIFFENVMLAFTRGEPKTVRTAVSSMNLDFFGAVVSVPRLIVLVVAIVLALVLIVYLRRSLQGMAVRAVSQDRSTAALMGINVNKLYTIAFGFSGAIAFLAGALISPIFTATPTIGFSFVLPAFAVVVLGGLGSTAGSLIGGLVVGVVEALSGYLLDPSLKQAVWFTLFLVVLVVRPAGMFGKAGAAEIGHK